MPKIRLILQKEWWELRQQRGLLASLAILPVLFTAMATLLTFASGKLPPRGNFSSTVTQAPGLNASLAGMTPLEYGQAYVGQLFSIMFLLLPLILPSIIAAHSIVGEKANRTLEPLLATPIRTWELLLGKMLTALIPTLAFTWLCGLIYIVWLSQVAVSARVLAAVINPGWLIVFWGCSPLLALIAIAVMVAISARVNDPRTAQQVSAWVVVPFLMVFLGQLSGIVVLSNLPLALGAFVVLGAVAACSVWAATALFQREVILTRWG